MIVSASEFKCFQERDELKDAIDSCFKGGEGAVSEYGTTVKISANEEDCNKVKATYGWPMNGWCTGDVTNMHFLFSGKRDFNEGESYILFIYVCNLSITRLSVNQNTIRHIRLEYKFKH